VIELEGHGNDSVKYLPRGRPWQLCSTRSAVYEQHGLADMHLHLHFQQAAMSVDDQRQRFFPYVICVRRLGDHRDLICSITRLLRPAVHRLSGVAMILFQN